jgi:hypothetical protein
MPDLLQREFKSDLPLPLTAEFRYGGGEKVTSTPNSWGQPFQTQMCAITPGIGAASSAPLLELPGSPVFGYTGMRQRRKQGSISSWLSYALGDLKEADAESAEDGMQPCAQIAKDKAKQILESLSEFESLQPSVYPTEDQEIAIFFRKERGGGTVLLLSDSVGGGACFSSIDGKNRRARYDDSSDMPDAFVKEQLLKLRKVVNAR